MASASLPLTTSSTTSQSLNVTAASTPATAQSASLGGAATPGGAAQSALTAETGQKRFPIRPIVDFIKKIPGLWTKAVNAVKGGWTKFLNWWNGLWGWVRSGIDAIWQGTVWELYVALRDWIF